MNNNNNIAQPSNSLWLRLPANFVSYIFHPLFIPTYILFFLVYRFPAEFANITLWKMKMKVFGFFWLTAFFPAFAVFLLWRLKFVDNILLRTQKERIIPYFVTMFFYWWMYYLSKNQNDQPKVLQFFFFGIFASTFIGVIINNFIKISLHTIAAASATSAIFLFSIYYQTQLGYAIVFSIVLSAIIATARLLVSNHTKLEINAGFALGIATQIIAYFICM
jgi:membrane-associated phospholipid phosphatase